MTSFTIVTVTFNAEAAIGRTLDSVLVQTHPAIEHLIIDGASTDNTLAVARQYKETSARLAPSHTVTIVSEADHGIYDAMNKGLARATGDYTVFLNAGDALPCAGTVAMLARLAEASAAGGGQLPGVLYGDTSVTDDNGNTLHPRRLRPPKSLSWRSFRKGMLVCHQAFYALTDIARNTPYDLHFRLSADVDWCIRVMRESERRRLPLANASETIALYTEQGLSTRNHRASLAERFCVMRRHYGLLVTIAMHAWFLVKRQR